MRNFQAYQRERAVRKATADIRSLYGNQVVRDYAVSFVVAAIAVPVLWLLIVFIKVI